MKEICKKLRCKPPTVERISLTQQHIIQFNLPTRPTKRAGNRHADKFEGDIDIVLWDSGEPTRPNWFWFIPFKDGRTSVGAVVSRTWIRDRRARENAGSPTDLFAAAVAESKTATRLLAPATRLWSEAEATADFSYRVGAMHGAGWVTVGDAGGFIDPLFSTGAHLAMHGALRAADDIHAALETGDMTASTLEPWEREMRAGASLFTGVVQAFYAGDLIPHGNKRQNRVSGAVAQHLLDERHPIHLLDLVKNDAPAERGAVHQPPDPVPCDLRPVWTATQPDRQDL